MTYVLYFVLLLAPHFADARHPFPGRTIGPERPIPERFGQAYPVTVQR